MKLYRLYVENVDPVALHAAVSKAFEGASMLNATGIWRGEQENACIVEVAGTANDLIRVRQLAQELIVLLNQDAVLLTESDVNLEWISCESLAA